MERLNGDDYWEQAIKNEMDNVRVAYKEHQGHTPEEIRDGKAPKLAGYLEITCHLVFDIKTYFLRKACFTTNGSNMETLLSIFECVDRIEC